jgi:hypothetical protein
MGRLQKHYPECWNCHRHFPHYLMVEAGRTASGRKRHFCVSCSEEYKKRKAAGG